MATPGIPEFKSRSAPSIMDDFQAVLGDLRGRYGIPENKHFREIGRSNAHLRD